MCKEHTHTHIHICVYNIPIFIDAAEFRVLLLIIVPVVVVVVTHTRFGWQNTIIIVVLTQPSGLRQPSNSTYFISDVCVLVCIPGELEPAISIRSSTLKSPQRLVHMMSHIHIDRTPDERFSYRHTVSIFSNGCVRLLVGFASLKGKRSLSHPPSLWCVCVIVSHLTTSRGEF